MKDEKFVLLEDLTTDTIGTTGILVPEIGIMKKPESFAVLTGLKFEDCPGFNPNNGHEVYLNNEDQFIYIKDDTGEYLKTAMSNDELNAALKAM